MCSSCGAENHHLKNGGLNTMIPMTIFRVHWHPDFEPRHYLRCTSQPQKLLKIPGPGPFQQLKRCHVLRCASLCFRCCNESLLGDPFIPWAPAIDGVELQAHPLDLLLEEKAGATAGPMNQARFRTISACVTNIRMDLKM